MMYNVIGMVRNSGADKAYKYTLNELAQNLKELRRRLADGDTSAAVEFFELYVFEDDDEKETMRKLRERFGP